MEAYIALLNELDSRIDAGLLQLSRPKEPAPFHVEPAPFYFVQKINDTIWDIEPNPPLYFKVGNHNSRYFYTLPGTKTIRIFFPNASKDNRNDLEGNENYFDKLNLEPNYESALAKLKAVIYNIFPTEPPEKDKRNPEELAREVQIAQAAEARAAQTRAAQTRAAEAEYAEAESVKATANGYKTVARQKKPAVLQKTPISGIEIHPLPEVIIEPEPGPRQPLAKSARFNTYYGKVDSQTMPIGQGIAVTEEGVQIYSPNWPETERLTFTCTNGLKFVARCNDDLKIQEFIGVLVWGTARINHYEIYPHIDDSIPMTKMFHHALDVVDSGWGDNSRYNLDYVAQHTGVVRVIVMSHGCIVSNFNLDLEKLSRRMTAPHGTDNFVCPGYNKLSLFQLFDSDPDAFERRMVDIARDTCRNPLTPLIIQKDAHLSYDQFKTSCSQMESTFNKEFKKGDAVMNRLYTSTGFAPIYLGYESLDKGWKYVNIFAHMDKNIIFLNNVLDKCKLCSECILIDNSCASPCSDDGPFKPSQEEMDSYGGTKRKHKLRKRGLRTLKKMIKWRPGT